MLKKEIVKNGLIFSLNFLFPKSPDGYKLAEKIPAFLFLHVFPGFYAVFVEVVVVYPPLYCKGSSSRTSVPVSDELFMVSVPFKSLARISIPLMPK